MMIYCFSKHEDSLLLRLQKRLWREFHPQAEFTTVQTPASDITQWVNRVMGWLGDNEHRYGFALHEDCLPLRRMDPAEILRGCTLAGRAGPLGGAHPSRTWILGDAQRQPGHIDQQPAWQGYSTRKVMVEDLPAAAAPELLRQFEYCEPGFLHLDSWTKIRPDHPDRLAKRDWIQSTYQDYVRLPSLRSRFKSFLKSVAKAADGTIPIITRTQWEERQRICRGCDMYEAKRDRCRACGCGIRMKARLKGQDCDLGRWPAIEDDGEE